MENLCKNSSTPWKNGYYHTATEPGKLWLVDGENAVLQPASGTPSDTENRIYKATWKFGDFGEALPDVAKESGKSRYNVEISMFGGKLCPKAVLSDDGKKLIHYGLGHCVDAFTWMSDEEVVEFKESGDPLDAMPHQYKEQPDNQGKLIWLSGAPGLGKSTSGLLLAKKKEYVYYEADCFMNHMNPFVSKDAEDPTIAGFAQTFLKGVPQERIDIVSEGVNDWLYALQGEKYDSELVQKWYLEMCKDIKREKKRIGGNWAIAQAVPKRYMRDYIREYLGPELIFVVLHMTKEDQICRIKARHGGQEDVDGSFLDLLLKSYDIYDQVKEDEPNAIQILVTKDMSKDDVVNKILDSLKKFD